MADYLYSDVALLVFARAPVPGLCKTRLIPVLGEQGAADLQQEMTQACVEQLCRKPLCPTQLWCSPDTTHDFFQSLASKYNLQLFSQEANDLGERMYQAMSQQHSACKIIVGTDIPLLTSDYILNAIEKLRQGNDAVIGPAEDGGYVLLGLKQIDRQLFEGIDWGSGNVFQQTCDKMTAGGLVWQALEPLWDLDNTSDLHRYQALKTVDKSL